MIPVVVCLQQFWEFQVAPSFVFLPVSPLMVVQVFHSQMAFFWPDQ